MAQLKDTTINGSLKFGSGVSANQIVSSLDGSTTHIPTSAAITESFKQYFKKYDTNETETVLIASKSVTFSEDTEHSSGFYVCAKDAVSPWSSSSTPSRDPIRKLKITWDGTSYICYGQSFTHIKYDDTTGAASTWYDCQMFGNGNNDTINCYNKETTDIPFALVQDLWENSGEWLIYAVNGSTATSHTIAISELTGTYNKITPEYQYNRLPDLKPGRCDNNIITCFNIDSDDTLSSLMVGDGNSVLNGLRNSVVTGGGNTIRGNIIYSTISGAFNTIKLQESSYYFSGYNISGYGNMIDLSSGARSDYSTVIGYKNEISSTSTAQTIANTVFGQQNKIVDNTTVTGTGRNFVSGVANELSGPVLASSVLGYKNKITSSDGTVGAITVVGRENVASNSCSFVAGLGNTTENSYQAVFGTYSEANADALLKIGNGTSDYRKNVFTVSRDGHINSKAGMTLADGNFQINNTGVMSKGEIPQGYLSWGGPNFNGRVSPLGCALSSEHNANRLAFLNPNAIKIESSTDGGATWTVPPYSDQDKVNLVTLNSNCHIGYGATEATTNCKLRITVTGQDGTNTYVYTQPRKLLINLTSPHAINVLIEKKTGQSDANWSSSGKYAVSGWSGWNDIPLTDIWTLGGSTTQTNNYWYMRLTFSLISINSSYSSLLPQIFSIRLIGDTGWWATSNMGNNGHLYSYDWQQNATFPAAVNITKDIKLTTADDQYGIFPSQNNYNTIGKSGLQWYQVHAKQIYENGTALESKYSQTGHNHDSSYVLKSGDTMTGPLKLKESGNSPLLFRHLNNEYLSGISYKTNGNEAMCFENKNAVTSFIFRTADPDNESTAWDNAVPSMQIKNQRVTINKFIANGTDAAYNLDVNGTLNAGAIYENGTLLYDKYIHFGDYFLPMNNFYTVKAPYNSKIDNIFWALNKREAITAAEYNSSGTKISDLSADSIAQLFDVNYDSYYTISKNNKLVITIGNTTTSQLSAFNIYPYGDLLVSFYYNDIPASITGRIYSNYERHGIGWHDITFSKVNGNNGVYKATIGLYIITKIEITITAQSSLTCSPTEIEFWPNRPDSMNQFPQLVRFGDQRLYGTLNADSFLEGGTALSNKYAAAGHSHLNLTSLKANTDNRDVATAPEDYRALFKLAGLKTNTVINSPSSDYYSNVIGLSTWSDTFGGLAHEFAINDSGLYHRREKDSSSNTWNSWENILTSKTDLSNNLKIENKEYYGALPCQLVFTGETDESSSYTGRLYKNSKLLYFPDVESSLTFGSLTLTEKRTNKRSCDTIIWN